MSSNDVTRQVPLRTGAFCRLLVAIVALLLGVRAFAAPPSFTGEGIRAQGQSTLVNLRAQGAIAGTAPMDVQVNAVRVGGLLSPLIGVLRTILQPGAQTSVCVEVTNLLGLDLSFLGVEIDVTAFNAEAPGGVSGRIAVRTGLGGEDTSALACADAAVLPPMANAGADQNLGDTDRQPGELVTLSGSASSDPDGTITSYRWSNTANQTLANGPTPTLRLNDGLQTVTLTVTDNTGATSTDTVDVRITAPATNQLPVANAGSDAVIADTDNQAGENVTLDGTSSRDPDGTIATYQWFIGSNTLLATGAQPTIRLPDGRHTLQLRVTDNAGGVASDTVEITIGTLNAATTPVANAGIDRIAPDTNQVEGETITLDASASTDPDGTIASYQWFIGTQLIATGITASLRFDDGEHFITLVVTDADGNTGSDGLLVTVVPPPQTLPIANAGADRTIVDSDAEAGEDVVLDGAASIDANGTIVSYRWMRNGLQIAAGANPTVRLPDGDNLLTLIVTDDEGNTALDDVLIAIAQPPFVAILSALPGLTENQRSVAVAMDTFCPRLQTRAAELSGDQLDLLQRCQAITFGSSPAEQVRALDQISPEELNATRTQTLNLSRSQFLNIADRLVALRNGAKGLSLVGLNLSTEDSLIPAEQIARSLDHAFGGGASADEAREGLFDDRLGLWVRGNYSFGDKDASHADHGFDADQWALLGGIDYRVTPLSVLGFAVGYGRSQVDFNPVGAGTLDTTATTAAVYATMYTKRGFYVDAIASLLRAGYDSVRHLEFTEGGVPLDLTARGDTGGTTFGLAFTLGYDFNVRAFTIAPSVGYNYMTSTIDGFREAGAAGLDLRYEEQTHVSGTANAGLRLSYAWKNKVGVIVPQLRGEYIREFIDERETFGVRFANDPFDDTPLIIVKTDVPDRSYWRLTGGFSAQFPHGISGFIEYQQLESLRYFDYAEVAAGLRFEASFE
jgi:outer membrane autotransporter protein